MFEERTRPKPFAEETLREKLLYKDNHIEKVNDRYNQPTLPNTKDYRVDEDPRIHSTKIFPQTQDISKLTNNLLAKNPLEDQIHRLKSFAEDKQHDLENYKVELARAMAEIEIVQANENAFLDNKINQIETAYALKIQEMEENYINSMLGLQDEFKYEISKETELCEFRVKSKLDEISQVLSQTKQNRSEIINERSSRNIDMPYSNEASAKTHKVTSKEPYDLEKYSDVRQFTYEKENDIKPRTPINHRGRQNKEENTQYERIPLSPREEHNLKVLGKQYNDRSRMENQKKMATSPDFNLRLPPSNKDRKGKGNTILQRLQIINNKLNEQRKRNLSKQFAEGSIKLDLQSSDSDDDELSLQTARLRSFTNKKGLGGLGGIGGKKEQVRNLSVNQSPRAKEQTITQLKKHIKDSNSKIKHLIHKSPISHKYDEKVEKKSTLILYFILIFIFYRNTSDREVFV